jgi:hypothetical protein
MATQVKQLLENEIGRTAPDRVVYAPGHYDGSTGDGLNEHLIVFDGPDGSLMAVWTQSAAATGVPGAKQVNRIVFARSTDEGATWTRPAHVVGPRPGDDGVGMASWAFPMVSRSGRILVVYNHNDGRSGWIAMHTGSMAAVSSDDLGTTWSPPQQIPMPHSPLDDPAGATPPEWIVWQRPMHDLSGGRFVGYTRWVNRAVAALDEVRLWTEIESVVEFMRFTNVDADPEPRDLEVRFSAWADRALRVPHWRHPQVSVVQEPSIVRLADQRLFCVMRTCSGFIWWSQSGDDGETWCSPRPLLDRDFGRPLLNPVSCDPMYQLADGRFILLYSNNRGDISSSPPADYGPRRPCYLAVGEFRPAADQPVWFSAPKLFMDTSGRTVLGALPGESHGPQDTNLSMYSSFTTRQDRNMLWYPDRKFYLLGKEVTGEFLSDLVVPS